jgi:hypothetical protein
MELEEILKGLELSGGIVITGNSRRVSNFLAALDEATEILKKINADGCVGCKHEECDITMGKAFFTDEEAIQHWNRRANDENN